MATTNNIRVYARVRPLTDSQTRSQEVTRCVQTIDGTSLRVTNFEGTGFTPFLHFSFDRVFNETSPQQQVFKSVAEDILSAAFEGINGTIFCYGQTASGKTFTCVGPQLNGPQRGLLPRIIQGVVDKIRLRPPTMDIRAKVTLVEIYNEKVTDLLDLTRRNLRLRQNKKKGVFIEHVSERYISRVEEGYEIVRMGVENRSVGSTAMNAASSRSHMLFMITIVQNDFATGEAKSAKLTVIDLAGSEKISKTGTEGKLLSEAIKINTSLSALGNVIHCLSQNKNGHIPYRDSKLTRLLQESLGGNSLTSLIVNVSPSCYNETETITTLRFGHRAKGIKNTPKINKEYTVEQLLGLLQKAELKIKEQSKIIDQFNKKKRVGGYGFIQEKPITLHILNDEDDDSNVDSNSQTEETLPHPPFSFKRPSIDRQRKPTLKSEKRHQANLVQLATSLRCIQSETDPKPKVTILDIEDCSYASEEPQDRECYNFTRSQSQADLHAIHQQGLSETNRQLKAQLQVYKLDINQLQQDLKRLGSEMQCLRLQYQQKEVQIEHKNALIQRLKQKNQHRKQQLQRQIDHLKLFWQQYYHDEQCDVPAAPS